MLQDGANLLDSDAGKPLNELCYERAVFKVIEERGYRNSGAAKYALPNYTLDTAFERRDRVTIKQYDLL